MGERVLRLRPSARVIHHMGRKENEFPCNYGPLGYAGTCQMEHLKKRAGLPERPGSAILKKQNTCMPSRYVPARKK